MAAPKAKDPLDALQLLINDVVRILCCGSLPQTLLATSRLIPVSARADWQGTARIAARQPGQPRPASWRYAIEATRHDTGFPLGPR